MTPWRRGSDRRGYPFHMPRGRSSCPRRRCRRSAGGDLGFVGTITVGSMEAGASYGILDDLTVEAHPLGFVAGDVDTDYTRFELGATYRFFKNEMFDVGARFRMQIDNGANLSF